MLPGQEVAAAPWNVKTSAGTPPQYRIAAALPGRRRNTKLPLYAPDAAAIWDCHSIDGTPPQKEHEVVATCAQCRRNMRSPPHRWDATVCAGCRRNHYTPQERRDTIHHRTTCRKNATRQNAATRNAAPPQNAVQHDVMTPQHGTPPYNILDETPRRDTPPYNCAAAIPAARNSITIDAALCRTDTSRNDRHAAMLHEARNDDTPEMRSEMPLKDQGNAAKRNTDDATRI
ncbi:6206_t:CDS:2 [Acaulospora morrowiae]|uniref:6206_t:CDS:1 n=1 Tax=Acaulospora morrowiae TaxID=94023 RepID=A0A9N9I6C0_9GLOM|nr:6206_t:CDS:2 [Acaulospora morrowiae]